MFRKTFHNDWPARLGDLLGHTALAFILPGRWYMQWVPDALLPLLFLYNYSTDSVMPNHQIPARVHRFNHSWGAPMVLAVLAGIGAKPRLTGALLCHWTAHIMLDSITHDNWKDGRPKE